MIKVLTYNIHHARGMDGRVSLARVAAVIRQTGASLVALQEVDRYRFRSGLRHQARWLARRLEMRHLFGGTLGWWIFKYYGNAVLSRYPVLSQTRCLLPGPGEQRAVLATRIGLPDGEAHFLCTHLGLSATARRAQVGQLLDLAAALSGPLILAGDFNCRPDAPELQPIRRAYRDTSTDPQGDLTFPSSNPEARIDFIFVSHHWCSTVSGTVSSPASDHLPYFAQIARCGT